MLVRKAQSIKILYYFRISQVLGRMAEYKSIIDDKDYCDQSELYMKEYKEYPTVQFEAQLEFINKWIADDTNTPLVIVGQAESGKKTLICSYIEQSKVTNPHWLHLCLFSSINPEYSHIIYKIMIQLRNHFKVEQKVDLNDEKLRRYFKYWLEVISDLIEKEYLGYVKAEIPKVVIVIEGIDEYFDNKGNKVETQFWLPHQIPKHIKLILSTKSVRTDQLRGSTILQHHLPYQKKEKILNKLSDKVKDFNHKYSDSSLYLLQILNKMVNIKPNFQLESGLISEILQKYISTVSNNSFSVEEIKSILYILTLSKKGLKSRWIFKIVSVSEQKWGLFQRCFSFLIVEQHNYYIICNKTAKTVIKHLVDPKGQKQKTYRQSISYSIRNEAVYLRELQEVVQQLYLSQTYTQLKEVISKVENFAMLYNPFSKDLLCQCWYKLQQLQQYDPVFEYNKAVQAYKSHYYPKEEELYKIIFQISMFFKEYSQFENARTPQFRHPLIKGENDQLQGIGIFQELKQLGMIGKNKVYKLKPLEKYSALKRNELAKNNKKAKTIKQITQEEVIKSEQKDEKHGSKKSKREKVKQSQIESADISRPQTSQSAKERTETIEFLLNIQQLNVSITANQQKFRQHFTNSMKQYLENYFIPMRKGNLKDRQLSFQMEQSDLQEEIMKDKVQKEYRFDLQKLKQTLILKKFREYLQETYHKSGEQMRFYYYKQWIWLEFPWICQTVKNNYSQMIKQCIPGSIHFMSPNQEFKFVKQALKIARNAKQSKINIFAQKKIEMLPLRYSAQKVQQLNALKKTNNIDKDKYYISRTKVSKDVSSVNKSKINLSTVDQMIYKQKQNEQFLKQKLKEQSRTLKGQSSLPNFNMFVTETSDKSLNLFPTLNKSKFALQRITNRRQKQNYDQTRDFTLVIKKYNEIKHENDLLVQKIQEMNKLSSIQMDKTKQEQQIIQHQIDHLVEKKDVLQKNTSNQSLLQKKLQVIIKICDLNKMYGSESQYLSTYLSNLKQMLSIQDERIRQTKIKIAQITQKGKNDMKQLRIIRKNLKAMKQQHDKLYLNLASDSTNANYKALPLEQIEEQLKQMQQQIKLKSRKQKSRIQRLINTQTYDILRQELGLTYGDDNSQNIIQEFADKIQKKKQLSLKNNDLTLELRKIKQQNKAKQQHLKSIQEGSVNAKKLAVSNSLIQNKKSLVQIRQRSLLIQQALKTLAQN